MQIGFKTAIAQFDPRPILRAIGRKKMQVYNKAAARTRLIARRKVRKRTKNYTPEENKPPRVRNTKFSKYRRGILYAYDRRPDSMVIGPQVISDENTAWLFETGGSYSYFRTDSRGRRRRVRAQMRKFPVMGPTATEAIPYYGGLFHEFRN